MSARLKRDKEWAIGLSPVTSNAASGPRLDNCALDVYTANPVDIRNLAAKMKTDWDLRAQENARFYIASDDWQNEAAFRASGMRDAALVIRGLEARLESLTRYEIHAPDGYVPGYRRIRQLWITCGHRARSWWRPRRSTVEIERVFQEFDPT